MRSNDVAGNGQSQTDSAGFFVTGFIQAIKRLKHVFTLIGRNTGTIIVNGYLQFIIIAFKTDGNILAIGESIGNNVGDCPFQSLFTPLNRTDLIIGRVTYHGFGVTEFIDNA